MMKCPRCKNEQDDKNPYCQRCFALLNPQAPEATPAFVPPHMTQPLQAPPPAAIPRRIFVKWGILILVVYGGLSWVFSRGPFVFKSKPKKNGESFDTFIAGMTLLHNPQAMSQPTPNILPADNQTQQTHAKGSGDSSHQ